jgi:hypothetical protein
MTISVKFSQYRSDFKNVRKNTNFGLEQSYCGINPSIP